MSERYIRQGNSTALPHYLLMDLVTGWTDGCDLVSRDDARRQQQEHQRLYPRGRWCLIELLVAPIGAEDIEPFWWRPGYDALLEKLK